MSDATLKDRITTQIIDEIRRGQYAVGDILAPASVISEQLNCSEQTVRLALGRLANRGIVESIRKKGTVVLRKPSVGRICVVLSGDDHFNSLLVNPLSETLLKQGFDIDIIPALRDPQSVIAWIKKLQLEPLPPECVVCLNQSFGNDELREMMSHFEYKISCNLEMPENLVDDCCYVALDAQQASRCVVEYFLGLGHRKIAVWTAFYEHMESFHSQVALFCKDLFEITGGECFLYYDHFGLDYLVEMIKKQNITAFLDLNDYFATKTLFKFFQEGLRVPEQISLMGKYDTPWCRECKPSLTSLSINPSAISEKIASIAQSLFRGDDLASNRFKVAPKVAIRDSTASCAS